MSTLKNTLINDTGYLTLPSGNTSQRPSPASTGMIRYNNQTFFCEVYNGSSWVNFTPQIAAPYATSGLCVYLDAGNTNSYSGSGTAWNDLSGLNNGTTLSGTYSYGSSPRGYISFGGGKAQSTNMNSWNIPGSGGITVEAWIWWNTFSPGNYQFFFSDTAAYWRTGIQNGGGFYWNMGNRSDKSSATTPVNTQTWQQLVWTSNGVTTLIYRNASQVVSAGDSGFATGFSAWILGQGEGGQYPLSNARMSIFRLYNRVLSPSEITKNWNYDKSGFGL